MSKTITVRVDDNLKETADSLFDSLGLDTTTAIRMFLIASIEAGGIPFAVRHNEDRDQTIYDSLARYRAGEQFSTIEESLASARAAIQRGAAIGF